MPITQDLTPVQQATIGSAGVVGAGVGVGMGLEQFGGRRFDGMTAEVAGGVTGVGVPVVLRETVDDEVGPLLGESGTTLARVTKPSAAWGIGGGAATAALWWADMTVLMDRIPDGASEFFMWHAMTGIPTGVASAVLGDGGGGELAEPGTRRRLEETGGGGGSPDNATPA